MQNWLYERSFAQEHARLTTALSGLFLFHSRYHTRLTCYSIFQLLTPHNQFLLQIGISLCVEISLTVPVSPCYPLKFYPCSILNKPYSLSGGSYGSMGLVQSHRSCWQQHSQKYPDWFPLPFQRGKHKSLYPLPCGIIYSQSIYSNY